MEDYLKNLNNSTKYKNDYMLVESYNIKEWNPVGMTKEITGGVIILVAMTGSGKTVLLNHIIADNSKDFDDITLICPTANFQPCYDYFPKENVRKTFEESYLEELWNKHEKYYLKNDKKKTYKTLVVMDDIIDLEEFKKSNKLNEIAHGGRHLGIYIIILSQDWNSIKPTIRKNARIVCSFQLPSQIEREKLTKACMSMENNHVGELLYRKITGQKYQCVVCKLYLIGVDVEEKINKFTADPNKKPKIKKHTQLYKKHVESYEPYNYFMS